MTNTVHPDYPETELTVRTARLAGRLLLESGAETYRVEDTVEYICVSGGLSEVSVISLPTGTIYSFVDEGGVPHSEVVRTKTRTTNLSVVAQVNEISRGITSGSLSMKEGCARLEALTALPPQPLGLALIANGVTASFFALLFQGGWFEFLIALVCGVLTRLMGLFFREDSVSSTLYALLSGALSAFLALLSVQLFGMGNRMPIIIGAIMPLLPGLAITNAIRDTVNGDLVSGVARTAEALLRAVAIAVGAGVVLKLFTP